MESLASLQQRDRSLFYCSLCTPLLPPRTHVVSGHPRGRTPVTTGEHWKEKLVIGGDRTGSGLGAVRGGAAQAPGTGETVLPTVGR
jgi:hypothetical protein